LLLRAGFAAMQNQNQNRRKEDVHETHRPPGARGKMGTANAADNQRVPINYHSIAFRFAVAMEAFPLVLARLIQPFSLTLHCKRLQIKLASDRGVT